MKHSPTQVDELISALADGELSDAEFDQVMWALQSGDEQHARWHGYQLVGDVLRSGVTAPMGRHDEAFLARLRPHLKEKGAVAAVRPVPGARWSRSSANDAVWRWKLVAGLSSLTVMSVLGWVMATRTAVGEAGMQLAQQQSLPRAEMPQDQQTASAATEPVMLRDPRLDRMIAAHQQLGGASALQMPAGFLRNATFERPAH